MLREIIAWSVRHRRTVILSTMVLVLGGSWALINTPVDAIPDLSDAQVIVMTEWPGQAPQLVEDQITYPLETELLKVPHIKVVRGMSQFGLSAVYVVFQDGTDLYWARSRVLEYLSAVRNKLPEDAMPMLGPDATGVGWVMQYILADTTGTRNLAELRTMQDFVVRPALTSVPGVAEIAALGGFEKEYQVEVDPVKLRAYGIPLSKVADAVRASNQDVGGRVLEMGGTEYVVRGRGRFQALADLRAVSLASAPDGTPITLGEVATVQLGPGLRRGITDLDGKGEVVTGWVVMRYGANPSDVISGVKAKMAELEPSLPAGVRFVQGYDRASLIERAVHTLREKLIEESIIVALVTLLFLMHARSALVAILTLPVGVLMALLAMHLLGLSANIMSLGGIAIAIGAMIDAAIVMVENLHKHVERNDAERTRPDGIVKSHWHLVVDSAQEVGPALFVSLLIITVSFLPVFALQDQEGRLFRPLAWTKTLAMASAALLSVTLVPVMMGLLIRGKLRPETSNPVNRFLVGAYRPLIKVVLRFRWTTIAVSVLLIVATFYPWQRLGSEFMPPLNEGAIMDMPSLAAGVGSQQAKEILVGRDQMLAAIPEVETVMGKVGRAESATDMAPMSMIETIVVLKDPKSWRPGVTYDSLMREVNNRVKTPGVANMWSMPIKNRLDMLATGIKTPVGVKVFGPNLDTLDLLSKRIEGVLQGVPGTNTVFAEKAVGGRYIESTVDRVAAARYGLSGDDVQMGLSTAIGGADAGQTIVGRERIGVRVRYPRELRDTPERLRDVTLPTMTGTTVSLGEVASINIVRGPSLIKSENASLTAYVYVDIRERDIGTYVAEAKALVSSRVAMPAGYRMEWSGQYESLERAERRLRYVVPITLLIIIGLLYASFRNYAEVGIILLSLPFSLVGGVWLMWWLGYHLSVAVAIGFIALAGVAAETGVIMLLYLGQSYRERKLSTGMNTVHDVDAAVEHGAVERVRPKMMTVMAIMAGLVPILWSTGTGADVMKRIAAPMVGGMITSTVLTLLVIPAIYSLWKQRELNRESGSAGRAAMRNAIEAAPHARPLTSPANVP